ncbi:MAG: DUF370 domain-containing protein [Clostridia bacterium]|nr:DUF370 domain-containing protein [Clostridia bacterium]MBP5208664.1 DUF370 domain-containing protein [Clostridia bacterium]
MYLHAGRDTVIREKKIVAVFDLDWASQNKDTLEFLRRAEKEGRIINVTDELPKAFILTDDGKIYFTQLSSQTLMGRI